MVKLLRLPYFIIRHLSDRKRIRIIGKLHEINLQAIFMVNINIKQIILSSFGEYTIWIIDLTDVNMFNVGLLRLHYYYILRLFLSARSL